MQVNVTDGPPTFTHMYVSDGVQHWGVFSYEHAVEVGNGWDVDGRLGGENESGKVA